MQKLCGICEEHSKKKTDAPDGYKSVHRSMGRNPKIGPDPTYS
jgi:hypothetical protein